MKREFEVNDSKEATVTVNIYQMKSELCKSRHDTQYWKWGNCTFGTDAVCDVV